MASMARYRDHFTFLYVDDVRTSQNTHLRASTACYRGIFTLLYVEDVRTSQETPMASMAGYRGSFTIYIFYRINFSFREVERRKGTRNFVPMWTSARVRIYVHCMHISGVCTVSVYSYEL
jgi:hypothetical protein